MSEKKNKKEKIINNIRKPYKLILYRSDTYEETWNSTITKLNALGYSLFFMALYTVLIISLIIFTPLNRLLPAYHDSQLQQKVLDNALRADSLEYEIRIRDQYMSNIRNILEGKEPVNYQAKNDSLINFSNIEFTRSSHDSILRKQIQEEQAMQISYWEENKYNASFHNLHFFTPAQGMVVNQFDANQKHFGIDIVSNPDEPIQSVLDGTVISADWTMNTGYVIRVQHPNNLISCYKHNSTLLKTIGDQVKAGETIAIIGNTGEFTTGPHLHFELWHNGTPIDPEDYILF